MSWVMRQPYLAWLTRTAAAAAVSPLECAAAEQSSVRSWHATARTGSCYCADTTSTSSSPASTLSNRSTSSSACSGSTPGPAALKYAVSQRLEPSSAHRLSAVTGVSSCIYSLSASSTRSSSGSTNNGGGSSGSTAEAQVAAAEGAACAASGSSGEPGTAAAGAGAAGEAAAAVDPVVEAAKQLTRDIRSAETVQQLLQIAQQHGADMEPIHVSAVFTCAKRLLGDVQKDSSGLQDDPVVQQLLQALPQLAAQAQQQCGARELENIIWACGYLQLPDVVMLLLPTLLQDHILQHADAWCDANVFTGAGTAGAVPAEQQLQQLLSAFMAKLPGTSPASVSSVMWLSAKLQLPVEQQQWQQLIDQLHNKLQMAKPRDISTAVWATWLSQHSVPQPQFEQLVQQLVCQVTKATVLDISRCFCAAAEMGRQLTEQQQDLLLRQLMQQLPHAAPVIVGDILCAASKMGMRVPAGQVQALLDQLLKGKPDMSPKVISNALWGVGKVSNQPPTDQLLEQVSLLVAEFEAVLHLATPAQLNRVLQAVYTLHAPVSIKPLERIVLQLLQKLPEATAQDASYSLCWIASLQLAIPEEDTQRLLDHVLYQLPWPASGPMWISSTVYNAGRLGLNIQDEHMHELIAQCLQHLSTAGAYSVSTMLCGVVSLGHGFAPQQLQAMLARFEVLMEGASAKDINRVFAAVGAHQHCTMYKRKQLPKPMQLWRQMLDRLVADMSGSTPHPKQLTTAAWAVMRLNCPEFLTEVLRFATACSEQWGGLGAGDLRRWAVVHRWLKNSGAAPTGLLTAFSKEQLQECEAAFIANREAAAAMHAASEAAAVEAHEAFQCIQP